MCRWALIVTFLSLARAQEPRDADPQAADRHGGPGSSDRLGGRAAGDAGHTARMPDWFSSTEIVVLAIVTAIGFVAFLIWELTEKHPDRRPVAVQEPQFRAGHAGLLPGLCRVLRQQSSDAAVAADPDRLHRDLGGAGGGAHRGDRGAADAADGAADVAGRCAHHRHAWPSSPSAFPI